MCDDDKPKKNNEKKTTTRKLKPKKKKEKLDCPTEYTPFYLESALYSPPAKASNSEKGGRVLGDSTWVSSDGGIGGIGGSGGGGGRAGWMESSGTRPSVLSHL